jgi:hypothetical protein
MFWQGICNTKNKTENFLHQFSSLMVNRERRGWPLFISAQKTTSYGCGQSSLALPWSFVSKITNSKHPAKKTADKQITNKIQIPIFNRST